MSRKTAREKVASLLAIFARRAVNVRPRGDEAGWTMQLPMTREQMADYLSTTLETVSRQMSALKRAGVIDIPEARTLVVADPSRLEAEAREV